MEPKIYEKGYYMLKVEILYEKGSHFFYFAALRVICVFVKRARI